MSNTSKINVSQLKIGISWAIAFYSPLKVSQISYWTPPCFVLPSWQVRRVTRSISVFPSEFPCILEISDKRSRRSVGQSNLLLQPSKRNSGSTSQCSQNFDWIWQVSLLPLRLKQILLVCCERFTIWYSVMPLCAFQMSRWLVRHILLASGSCIRIMESTLAVFPSRPSKDASPA